MTSNNEDDYNDPAFDNSPNDDVEIEDFPKIVYSPLVQTKINQWQALVEFLNKWFYKPDVEALRICLAAYVSHFYLDSDPVWLFIIAPPGSGKTSIGIKALSFLEHTHKIGDIGPNSFLSGFGENNGLLGHLNKNANGNGVILFPDFTGLLSKRTEVRTEVMGQMRQIYDGEFFRTVGNKGDTIHWKGKLTCIAAVTPALEDHWSVNRNLGERFLNVRWHQPDIELVADKAEGHFGKEAFINETFKKLVTEYVDVDAKFKRVSPKKLGLTGVAYLVSVLRTIVHRDQRGRVTNVDEPETPTRIAKGLSMIAVGSATLDRRAEINAEDVGLAKRVAIDSLSKYRGKIIEELFNSRLINGKFVYEKTEEELERLTEIPKHTLERTLEDLKLVKAIRIDEGNENNYISITDKMRKAWEDGLYELRGLDLDEIENDSELNKRGSENLS